MPSNPLQPGEPEPSPFIRTLQHALSRLQERESIQPEQLTRRAAALLDERFGVSEEAAHTAFAPACIGLMSEHTHYFDGFALMMPTVLGTALALRRTHADTSQLVKDGTVTVYPLRRSLSEEISEPDDRDALWAYVVEALLRSLPNVNVESGLVTSILDVDSGAYLTALGVALELALRAAKEEPPGGAEAVGKAIAQGAGRPFSIAYPIAAGAAGADTFVLVDTHTREMLTLEAPPRDAVGWGLVFPGSMAATAPEVFRERKAQTEEALGILRKQGFPELTSFRELEHVHLHRALDALPEVLRPLVRYLVGENRRVQKLVAAIRRKDWQLFGALLLMSYASQRNDLLSATPEMDAVVDLVEQMSIDGMYGTTVCGWSQCMVVVGQPFVVPGCLDRIQSELNARFGITPVSILL